MDLAEAQSTAARGHGLRRGDRRRRPRRPRGGDPAEADRSRICRSSWWRRAPKSARISSPGAVIDPIGLDRLLPDWREDADAPLKTPVTDDRFYLLGPAGRPRLPNFADAAADEQPRQFHRLARQCLPLAGAARPRRSASRSIRASPRPRCFTARTGEVIGVATGDMGIGRDGEPKDGFTRGMELRGKYVLFAEGARGSPAKQLIAQLRPRRRPRAAEIRHRPEGALAGRAGEAPAGAGPALVRLAARQCAPAAARSSTISRTIWSSVGFVVHLNYQNPTLSPFDEFQRFKTHPLIATTFEGGKRIGYGARAITEGGWQSVPKLVLPGRRADRLRGGFRQRAAHQGLAQRDAVGDAGGRTRRRRARGRPRQ